MATWQCRFQKWSEKVQSGKKGTGKENREIGVNKTDPYGIANFLIEICEGRHLFWVPGFSWGSLHKFIDSFGRLFKSLYISIDCLLYFYCYIKDYKSDRFRFLKKLLFPSISWFWFCLYIVAPFWEIIVIGAICSEDIL